jgi:hypothetical protein
MPSRKQRQRKLKAKRHEYETVWLDADGNELEEAPPELVEHEEQKKKDKAVATTSKGAPQQRGGRTVRQPPEPSWNRALKRAALLGIVVFFLFSLTARHSSNRYLAALIPAVIYTAMFIPLTFFIDRFAYRRWQARQAGGAATPQRPAAKKR